MSFKTILVPLDGTDISLDKLPTAHAVARRFDGHLDVLYLNRSPQESLPFVFGSLGAKGLRDNVLDAAQREGDERRRQLRQRFDDYCRDHNLALSDRPTADGVSIGWREAPAGELIDHARMSDLISVIRTPNDRTPWLLESTLLETGRPVLLVPPQAPDEVGRRVVIGWNDSAEAARATAAALPFLRRADEVSVLCAAKRRAGGERLVGYLAWHGIAAGYREFDQRGGVGAVLLEQTRELNADLFVIGAYSRTRASQLLFGGVTQHVIGHAQLPVLMAH